MFDIRINTFLTVCRHLNFTRAAKELSITQPAVSQHIRFLETDYQVKLFHQTGKKISLTEAGQLLKRTAVTMKQDDLRLRRQLTQLNQTQPKIIIGATRTSGEFVLPKDLAKYLCNNPTAQIQLVIDNTKELLRKLDEGDVHCAVIEGDFSNRDYDSLLYSREAFIAVSADRYPFQTEPRYLEDLFSERLIIRERGSGSREILESYLADRNLRVEDFHLITEVSNVHAIKTLVEEGAGITFLYEVAVREELLHNRIKHLSLQNFHLTHDVRFIWRRGSIFEAGCRQLYEQLKYGKDANTPESC